MNLVWLVALWGVIGVAIIELGLIDRKLDELWKIEDVLQEIHARLVAIERNTDTGKNPLTPPA